MYAEKAASLALLAPIGGLDAERWRLLARFASPLGEEEVLEPLPYTDTRYKDTAPSQLRMYRS